MRRGAITFSFSANLRSSHCRDPSWERERRTSVGHECLYREHLIMLHVPLIEPDICAILPARYAAVLEAKFEREFKEGRREKVQVHRDRRRRSDDGRGRFKSSEG